MVTSDYDLRAAPEYGARAVSCVKPRAVFRPSGPYLYVCNVERPDEDDRWLVVDAAMREILNEAYPGLLFAVDLQMRKPLDSVVMAG